MKNQPHEEPLDTSTELVEEDCMLCLEAMHPGDRTIPMLCPLPGCPFNYCGQCVWNLLLSSSQPYQEASDGSRQLKVQLQCPQCRTKYPHRQIVQDILLLRQAVRLEPLFFVPEEESSLRASDLSARNDFKQQVTLESLKEAWLRVNKYLQDRSISTDNHTSNSNHQESVEVSPTTTHTSNLKIPALPAHWKDHLSLNNHTKSADPTHETSAAIGMGQAQYDIVDPTLFQGMDETMTLSEQEFLSKLLVSGSVSNLMHAAQVLWGMLQLMLQGGLKARSTQNNNVNFKSLSSSGADNNTDEGNNNNNLRMLTTGTTLLYPDMEATLLRKRFPLPKHMPRWIVLPVYHPSKRGMPLQFKDNQYGLEITAVKGIAGQQGLRKGDIVTHINEEPCATSTPEDFNVYMKGLFKNNVAGGGGDGNTVTLVVNAHLDTASALQQRSFEMIHFVTNNNPQQQPTTS